MRLLKNAAAAALAAAFLLPASSNAQGVYPFYGAATQGHALVLGGAGTQVNGYRDAGIGATGACALNYNCGITDLPLEPLAPGLLNGTFTPFGIYDNQTSTGNYHFWQFGYVGGVPTMTLGGMGSAGAIAGLNFNINGSVYAFPGPGNGDVMGPVSTTVNHLSCWNNTGGTLLSDCTTISPNLTFTGNNTYTGTGIYGADQFAGTFGPVTLMAANTAGDNTIVGQVVNNLPSSTFALPVATTGACKMTSSGNQCFGIYGLAELRQSGTNGGVGIGGEVTVRNFTNNNPDINLPPNESIGTTTTVPNGWQITCGAGGGETKDCSIGFQVSNETGSTSDPVFNTGGYIHSYRQYGLFIDAMPSGNQTTEVLQNNGTGINLQLGTTGNMTATNSVITALDKNSVSHFNVRQNGDTYVNTLGFVGHTTAPTLGSCGTSPTLNTVSTDAHGIIGVGSGTTSCVVNFGTAYTQLPVIVITGENVSGISITAKSLSSFTVGGSGLASTTFDYIVASSGSL